MFRIQLTCLSLFAVVACQSSGPVVVDVDTAQRDALFGSVSALEGNWRVESGGPAGAIEFRITSGGSVVCETMFPGTDSEMTNMYSLDGNSLVMTHYCAIGNQPHMRATAIEGNQLVFAADGVSDLKASDDHYMGAMTLVIIDEDTIEQRWIGYSLESEGETTTFRLTRVH